MEDPVDYAALAAHRAAAIRRTRRRAPRYREVFEYVYQRALGEGMNDEPVLRAWAHVQAALAAYREVHG